MIRSRPRSSLALGSALALLSITASPALAQHAEDQHSPTDAPLYAVAESSGAAQSPINILTDRTQPARHDIAVRYRPSGEHIVHRGHTIEAEFEPGSTIAYDGLLYELQQMHFHTPAEHLIDGITYPMEMHFVHTLVDRPEKLLVVGVLFREGRDNAFIEEILSHAPAEPGARFDGAVLIDPSDVLPAVEGYYHYEGSLTTPPYSETVTWLVLKDSRQASASQIERLNRLEGNNARHIQDIHGRHVDGE
jgi:carbonic anhydrase